MRLFLDSNIMTYVAFFEPFLCEGTPAALESSVNVWTGLQGCAPDESLLREVQALRVLYSIDDQAHFDWLFSDLGVDEVLRIRAEIKKRIHYDLLDRLFEHRHDVYVEEGRNISADDQKRLLKCLFPNLSARMRADALQYCEAVLVEADYFLTNDVAFIETAAATGCTVTPIKASDLPFVSRALAEAASR